MHKQKKITTFALAKQKGAIAQLVEQRTENPCVPGSIPGGTTKRDSNKSLFCLYKTLQKKINLTFIEILHSTHLARTK